MDREKIKTILGKTRETLRVFPEAREDDRVLYERLLAHFHPDAIRRIDGEIWTKATDHDIPSYDAVLRMRRVVQNVNREYLPSLSVAISRGMEEKEWRDAMNTLPLWGNI